MRPSTQMSPRILEQSALQRAIRSIAKDVQRDPAWLTSDGLEAGWRWVLEQPRTREEIEHRLDVIEQIVDGLSDESVNGRLARVKEHSDERARRFDAHKAEWLRANPDKYLGDVPPLPDVPVHTREQDERRAQYLAFLGTRYALRWVLGIEPLGDEPHVMDSRGTWGPPHDSDYYRIRFLAEQAADAERLTIAEAVRRKKKRREERKELAEEKARRLQVERQAELNAIGVDQEHA